MNMQIPFFPSPYPIPKNIEEEIIKLKLEITNLNERIKKLENTPKRDYMQKDDNFYMM